MRRALLLSFAGVALLLVGCGTIRAQSGAPVRLGATTIRSEAALSSSWADEGHRLREYKKEQNAKVPPGQPLPENAADFAYESLPVDITGDGKYTLYFGPVDTWFNWPQNPRGVTYNFPPDAEFSVIPSGPVKMATVNGKRYLEVGVTVSGFTGAPYTGFTGWAY